MKKTLLTLCLAAAGLSVDAQTLLHNNGPFVTDPGAGSGGADVSAIQTGLNNFGFNNRRPSNFRVAEDFTVPAGATWNIDSLVFFGYQTNSPASNTINQLNLLIWNGPPGATGSTIVYGDTAVNALTTGAFTGIYRVSSTAMMGTTRPIMSLLAATPNLTLAAGTYWIDWQAGGSLSSGPWVPPVTVSGQTGSGNAMQFGSTQVWAPLMDGPGDPATGATIPTYTVSLPFRVVGSVVTGTNAETSLATLQLFPNPAANQAVLSFDAALLNNQNVQVTITDALGRVVRSYSNLGGNQVTIERAGLQTGIYVVELSSEAKVLGRTRLVLE